MSEAYYQLQDAAIRHEIENAEFGRRTKLTLLKNVSMFTITKNENMRMMQKKF